MGGFGGQQASAPTISPEQTGAQIGIYNQNIGRTARATGNANRNEIVADSNFGFRMLGDSGELLNETELKKLRAEQKKQEATLAKLNAALGKTQNPKKVASIQAQIDDLTAKTTDRASKITSLADPNFAANRIKNTFSEQYAMRDAQAGRMRDAQAPTSEYTRMQDALGRGITAQTLGQRSAALSQANAAGIGQVADVRAQQVGAGMLGDTLMGRALNMASSQGMLTPEALRDATQQARASMAARGMATGSAGLAAELLNRDRYSRQRMFQDLGFAQGVQGQDLERQLANAGNVLRADQGNQQTQFGREQIISGNQQQANLANMQSANQMSQFNTTLAANTDLNNANFADSTNRYNMGLTEQSALRSNEERARQLGLGSDLYNFMMSTDPKLMAAGLGSPYANLTGSTSAASNVVGGIAMNPQYAGGQFSSGNNTAGNMLAGGFGGAAAMVPTGNPYLIAGGGAVGLLSGALQK